MDSSLLSDALVVWTGWGRTSQPSREHYRLVEVYGSELAASLLPKIQELEDDFYESDAKYVASDVNSMGNIASDQFRIRHPNISEQAVQALSWCYTYTYK